MADAGESSLSWEEHRSRLADGLGSSRYKEYDLAPFAHVVHASVDKQLWTGVFYSWLSVKGHLQAMHGQLRADIFATAIGDDVHVMFITIWHHPEALSEWMRNGYSIDQVLRALGVPEENIDIKLMRDFS